MVGPLSLEWHKFYFVFSNPRTYQMSPHVFCPRAVETSSEKLFADVTNFG